MALQDLEVRFHHRLKQLGTEVEAETFIPLIGDEPTCARGTGPLQPTNNVIPVAPDEVTWVVTHKGSPDWKSYQIITARIVVGQRKGFLSGEDKDRFACGLGLAQVRGDARMVSALDQSLVQLVIENLRQEDAREQARRKTENVGEGRCQSKRYAGSDIGAGDACQSGGIRQGKGALLVTGPLQARPEAVGSRP